MVGTPRARGEGGGVGGSAASSSGSSSSSSPSFPGGEPELLAERRPPSWPSLAGLPTPTTPAPATPIPPTPPSEVLGGTETEPTWSPAWVTTGLRSLEEPAEGEVELGGVGEFDLMAGGGVGGVGDGGGGGGGGDGGEGSDSVWGRGMASKDLVWDSFSPSSSPLPLPLSRRGMQGIPTPASAAAVAGPARALFTLQGDEEGFSSSGSRQLPAAAGGASGAIGGGGGGGGGSEETQRLGYT